MSVVDFAALPPEVNSGRMYAGAGSGPMVAAAAAWDGLASELSTAANSYQSLVAELTGGPWLGPASTAMTDAAAPYVAWMHTTASQAEQTANQARSAAAAYQTAFMATVPPPVITANRTLLASLVATNILGQNTPAIAATETHYAEMWAQDAAAMYGYAGASATATQLTPFSSAPQNTNPAGTANQAAATTQAATNAQSALSTVPNTLQGLASGAQSTDPTTWLLNLLNSTPVQEFEGLVAGTAGYQTLGGGVGFLASGLLFMLSPGENVALMAAMAAAAPAATPVYAVSELAGAPEAALGETLVGSYGSGMSASGSAGVGAAEVSAGLGRAGSVGGLSVPQSWGTAAPEIRLAARGLPMAGSAGLPELGAAGPGGFGGAPLVGPVGSVVNAPRNGEARSRYGPRPKVIPAMGGEPGGHDDALDRWVNSERHAADRDSRLSERDELNELRRAIAGLAKERDVLKRSAALLIKEAMQR